MGKGWSARTIAIQDDPKGWGRYAVTKLQGKASKQLWLIQVYVCRLNKDSDESYYNMQKRAMELHEKESGKRSERTAEGELCPHLQLQADLAAALMKAQNAGGVQVIMSGDFNESWRQGGPWKQWVQNTTMKNMLQDVPGTGGDTTCFPNNGTPSDIDWVLTTRELASKGWVQTGVKFDCMDASAHGTIFITVQANKWLNLKTKDTTRTAAHIYAENHIKGPEEGKKVRKFQQLLWEAWEKHGVEFHSWRQELMVEKWRQAKMALEQRHAVQASGADVARQEVEECKKQAVAHVEHTNTKIIASYTAALNKMQHTYGTGKKRKPLYGGPPMVEIRKLCTLGRKLAFIWRSRKSQQNPFTDGIQQRGQNRGGKRQDTRGGSIGMQELRMRIRSYFKRLGKQNNGELHTLIKKHMRAAYLDQEAHGRLQTRGSNKMARRIRHWDEVVAGILTAVSVLAPKLNVQAREYAVEEHAAKKGQRKFDSRTRKLRQFLDAASEKPARSKAIEKIRSGEDGKGIMCTLPSLVRTRT